MSDSCLICNKNKFNDLISINKFPLFFGAIPLNKKKSIEEFPLAIAQCQYCGHVQQINLIDETIINRVYDAEYYNCPSPVNTGMGTREIEKFYSFFKDNNLRKGKLLEIACFDGYLLNKMKKNGWDVYGCDPSPMSSTAEEIIGNQKIEKKYFNKELYPKNSFDCIIFRNLLEHIYDLHKFLESVTFCLKDNGRIFIDVPNLKTYEPIGGFGMFFHQHISYFSINSLRTLLSLYGFQIEREYDGNPNLFVQARKTSKTVNIDNLIQMNNINDSNIFKNKQMILIKKLESFFSNKKKIALFGASAVATFIISILGKKHINNIIALVDNDKGKKDKELYGLNMPIISLNDISSKDVDYIFITTYFFDDEIRQQLLENDFPKEKIISINSIVNN